MLKLKIHIVTGMRSCGSSVGVFLRLFSPTLPPFTPLLHLSEALTGVDLKTFILSPERKALISSPAFFHVSCMDLPSLHVGKGAGQGDVSVWHLCGGEK